MPRRLAANAGADDQTLTRTPVCRRYRCRSVERLAVRSWSAAASVASTVRSRSRNRTPNAGITAPAGDIRSMACERACYVNSRSALVQVVRERWSTVTPTSITSFRTEAIRDCSGHGRTCRGYVTDAMRPRHAPAADMRHRVRSRLLHPDAAAARCRAAFVEFYGEHAAAERQRQIDQLPVVDWRGQRMHTLRCHGTTGRGPHDYNVPTALLWALIDLRRFVCPFHHSSL